VFFPWFQFIAEGYLQYDVYVLIKSFDFDIPYPENEFAETADRLRIKIKQP
jgi:hypothetical protein